MVNVVVEDLLAYISMPVTKELLKDASTIDISISIATTMHHKSLRDVYFIISSKYFNWNDLKDKNMIEFFNNKLMRSERNVIYLKKVHF